MTDYIITNGRAEVYPSKHYGAHFTGNRATFCLEADFATFDANVQAIPHLPITLLTASPVQVDEKFFGMHVRYRANDAATEITHGTVRSHDFGSLKSHWHRIQTTASADTNTWDWTELDSWVNTHYAAGRDLIFTLFGTPTFYSARPTEHGAYGSYWVGIQAEPTDMTKWSAFCTAVATRYLGKIKYYEVWNEPNLNSNGTGPAGTTGTTFFFSGTFAQLAEMTRLANQAIKAVDSTAKIICPAVTSWATSAGGSAENYFTGMMAAATGDGSTTMKDWVDIIGVHLYIGGNDIAKLSKLIDRVSAAITTAGLSGKEVWDTESAPIFPDVSGMPIEAAKLYIARSMIIQAAKGINRTCYFQYDERAMGIKRTGIVSYRERIRELLMSGAIQSACIFNDGRVGYYMPAGLSTI